MESRLTQSLCVIHLMVNIFRHFLRENNFLGNILHIIALYIPPHTSRGNHDLIFDAIKSLHCLIGANVLIIGDFNTLDYSANPGHPLSKSLNNFVQFPNL